MESKEFVEILMRRCMAQTLEEFEQQVETPLRELHGTLSNGATARHLGRILDGCDEVKRTFRKKIQGFETDCLALIPRDLEINAVQLVRSSR